MRWWGWGDDGHRARPPPERGRRPRDELGVSRVARAGGAGGHRGWARRRCPRDARAGAGVRLARTGCATTTPPASRTPPGRAIPTWFGCVAATGSAPPRSAQPGSADEVRGRSGGLCAGGCGRGPVRRRHQRGGRGGASARRLRARGLARPPLGSTASTVDQVSSPGHVRGRAAGPARSSAELGAQGLTLGHFPPVIRVRDGRGWVATRSAGQASTGTAASTSSWRVCGSSLRPGAIATRSPRPLRGRPGELVVGSEGVLGVITEATLRVRPGAGARRYEGWSFRSFAEGVEAFRVMEQAGSVAGRGAAVGRGGDTAVAGARVLGSGTERLGARTCAHAGTRAAAW